jgi:HEAT repeat protein
MVGTRATADYFLSLASTNDRNPGRAAIFPVTLVDSATVWPSLMRIARDERRPRNTRTQAVFWLGQLAEEPATAGLNDLVGESDVDREVRKSAIFALSQRRDKEGIPYLIRVVRTNRDPELRKQALFWLAQSNDPRALDLIEELLTKK